MDNRNSYPFKPHDHKRLANGTILIRHTGPGTQPTKGHEDDAGWDLYCTEDRIIWPKCVVDLSTGWDINVPPRTWGLITARSSTSKKRRLIVHPGIIDPGYAGPLSVLVWNPGYIPRIIKAGDRLAQLIIIPLPPTTIQRVNSMPITSRGGGCFGSTGR